MNIFGLFDPISGIGLALWVVVVIFIWDAVWKLIAIWKAARNDSIAWFIVLAVLNTVGILPILYIFVFSKLGKRPQRRKR